ncbi:MAG: alpha/beta fold hydrolase [Gemmatimonadales bacterium]|nr:alpha/beta fold hydrolase [Gemmatimonadales bacterium]
MTVHVPLVSLGDGFGGRVLQGDGEGVLWIHSHSLDSRSWIELWELLPGWNHLGIDLPGHGVSLPASSHEALPDLARRIGEIAHRRDIRHMVGLSFGSLVALQVAIEYPSGFASLVVGAPVLGGGPHEEETVTRYQELRSMYLIGGFGPHLRGRWMLHPPSIFDTIERESRLWNTLSQIIGRHAWLELLDGSLFKLLNHQQRPDQLQRITAATLVLVGERDRSVTKACAERLCQAIPTSQRVDVPAAGHLCMLEAPGRVHAAINDHMRRYASPVAV